LKANFRSEKKGPENGPKKAQKRPFLGGPGAKKPEKRGFLAPPKRDGGRDGGKFSAEIPSLEFSPRY